MGRKIWCIIYFEPFSFWTIIILNRIGVWDLMDRYGFLIITVFRPLWFLAKIGFGPIIVFWPLSLLTIKVLDRNDFIPSGFVPIMILDQWWFGTITDLNDFWTMMISFPWWLLDHIGFGPIIVFRLQRFVDHFW